MCYPNQPLLLKKQKKNVPISPSKNHVSRDKQSEVIMHSRQKKKKKIHMQIGKLLAQFHQISDSQLHFQQSEYWLYVSCLITTSVPALSHMQLYSMFLLHLSNC